ncbi:hypothetical protein [Novosphingobium sp. 9U]|uniref:hypothetical protein n=1 Tax=Novosphingobium sp. 9U TaxID=2653158 RepID=UPI0012F05250|nr:hypothetical protein [Novosphingobium sp. 9U]VWX48787.1 exported hypothetical protein [Novosphingobium sp. 9U]
MRERTLLYLTTCAVLSVISGNATAYPVPPPPRTGMEIFNPVDREQSVLARCAASRAVMKWSFTKGRVHVRQLRFNATSASAAMLTELDQAAATLKGDIAVRLDCSNEGAALTMIEERSAGSARSRSVRFDYAGGRLLRID